MLCAWRTATHAELQEALTRLRYEGKVTFRDNVRNALLVLRRLQGDAIDHTALQERVIFPFVARRMPRLGPLTTLFCHEHTDLRKAMVRLASDLHRVRMTDDTHGRSSLVARLYDEGSELALSLRLHDEGEREALLEKAWSQFKPAEKKEFLDRVGGWLIIKKNSAGSVAVGTAHPAPRIR